MTDITTSKPAASASERGDAVRGRPWLVALAAGVACSVCLVPALVVGGALAGVAAAVAGWWWLGGLLAIVGAGALVLRRGQRASHDACGCEGC